MNLLDLTEKTSFVGTEQMYCVDGSGSTNDKRNTFTNFFNWISQKVFSFIKLKDVSGSYSTELGINETLTGNRRLSIATGDSNRSISLNADLAVSGDGGNLNQDVGILGSPEFYEPQIGSDSAHSLTMHNIATANGDLNFNVTGNRTLELNGDLTTTGDRTLDQDVAIDSSPVFSTPIMTYANIKYGTSSSTVSIRNISPTGGETLDLDMRGGIRQITMNGDLDIKSSCQLNQNLLTTSTPQFDRLKDDNGVEILNIQQPAVNLPAGTPAGVDKYIITDIRNTILELIARLENHGLIDMGA